MRELKAILIQEELIQDALGQYLGSREQRRPVFVRLRSVSRAEWAAAGQRGLRPQLQLSLFAPDYRGESLVELEGRRYSVYRSYLPKGGQRLELYLEPKEGKEEGIPSENPRGQAL